MEPPIVYSYTCVLCFALSKRGIILFNSAPFGFIIFPCSAEDRNQSHMLRRSRSYNPLWATFEQSIHMNPKEQISKEYLEKASSIFSSLPCPGLLIVQL